MLFCTCFSKVLMCPSCEEQEDAPVKDQKKTVLSKRKLTLKRR